MKRKLPEDKVFETLREVPTEVSKKRIHAMIGGFTSLPNGQGDDVDGGSNMPDSETVSWMKALINKIGLNSVLLSSLAVITAIGVYNLNKKSKHDLTEAGFHKNVILESDTEATSKQFENQIVQIDSNQTHGSHHASSTSTTNNSLIQNEIVEESANEIKGSEELDVFKNIPQDLSSSSSTAISTIAKDTISNISSFFPETIEKAKKPIRDQSSNTSIPAKSGFGIHSLATYQNANEVGSFLMTANSKIKMDRQALLGLKMILTSQFSNDNLIDNQYTAFELEALKNQFLLNGEPLVDYYNYKSFIQPYFERLPGHKISITQSSIKVGEQINGAFEGVEWTEIDVIDPPVIKRTNPTDDRINQLKNYRSIEEAMVNPEAVYVLFLKKQLEFHDEIFQLPNLTKLILQSSQFDVLPSAIGQLSKLNTLSLARGEFSQLPDEIGQLSNLEYLRLNNNRFVEVPESIGQLSKLLSLELSRNQLTSLINFSNLKFLKTLNIHYNQLEELPPSIGKLISLERLNAENNQLKSLPETIGDLDFLQELRLSNNELTELPSSIGAYQFLTRLNLGNNQLQQLPESIGNLSALENLSLGKNEINQLPTSIGNLTNLLHLDLEDNELNEIPESISALQKIEYLSVKNNKITTFPNSILQLKALETLDLSGNEFTDIPSEIEALKKLKLLYLNDTLSDKDQRRIKKLLPNCKVIYTK